MTEHVTAVEQTPIYAAVVRELSEPDTDWSVSAPPEFADELIQKALGNAQRRPTRLSTKSKAKRKAAKAAARNRA